MMNQSYQKYATLEKYARQIVDDYATYVDGYYSLTVDKVPELEMSHITSLLIDYYDFDINHVCDEDVIISLNRMLSSCTKESAHDYATLVKDKTIAHYEDEIANLLREACSERDMDAKDSYDEDMNYFYREDQPNNLWR